MICLSWPEAWESLRTRAKLLLSGGIVVFFTACAFRSRRAIEPNRVRRKPIPVYDELVRGDPALRPAWRAKHPNVISLREYIESLEGMEPSALIAAVGRRLDGAGGLLIRMLSGFSPSEFPASLSPAHNCLLNLRLFSGEATLFAHCGLLCRNVFGAPLEYRRVLQAGTLVEKLATALNEMSSEFVASADVPRLIKVLDPKETPLVPVDPVLLPGLMAGTREQFREGTPEQRARSEIWASILNRLTANALASHDVPFQVRLRPDGPVAASPTELLSMLAEDGNDVSAIVRSGLTSFSNALTVSEMRCPEDPSGACDTPEKIVALRLHAKSMEGIDYLMPHCSVRLRSTGTLATTFVCEWYFGSDGFTRWVGGEDLEFPWLTPYRTVHWPRPDQDDDAPITPKANLQRALAIEGIVTASILAVLTLVEKRGDCNGGYPSIGSCNDSSALVEYILEGATTIYPMHGNASGRIPLAECCLQLANANPQGYLSPWFQKIAKALVQLPEDWAGGGDPSILADRARRYSAMYASLHDGPFECFPNIEGMDACARSTAELWSAVHDVRLSSLDL